MQGKQLFGEPPQNLKRRILVRQKHIAPHGRITGGDTGEIPETGGRVLDDFAVCYPLEIVSDTHHRVSDQMWRVACDGQHTVMMIRIHFVHIGAKAFPKGSHLVDSTTVTAFNRHNQQPTVFKQLRKAAFRAGMLGASQWVRRHKMHICGQNRPNTFDHVAFDRTHIGDRGTRLQMRCNLGCNLAHDANRDTQDDQIRVLHSFNRTITNRITKPDLAGGVAGFRRPCITSDMAHRPCPFARPKDGRRNKPKPDQGNPFVNHTHAAAFLNWVIAWTTRRHPASSPTVIRRQCGRLYPATMRTISPWDLR